MDHIFSHIKIYSTVLFLLLLLIFGITVYLDIAGSKLYISQTIINGVGILGVYFTILGIGYTFKQVLLVKEEVQNKLEELNEFLSFSDISSTVKQTREIQTFIQNKKYESALLRMKDLKSKLIDIKCNHKLEEYIENGDISIHLTNIEIDISNINETMLSGKSLNYTIVSENLEKVITCLENIVGQLKNKKL